MNSSSNNKKPWLIWFYVVALLPTLYIILYLAFGDLPLILRLPGEAARGDVPDVRFIASGWMFLWFADIIAFLACFFQVMRLWARYYLSRKLLLSYLFFAIIPLTTALLIFVTITRVMLGISSLLTFEDAADSHAVALVEYSRAIHHQLGQNMKRRAISAAVRSARSKLPIEGVDIRIFWASPKSPGQRRHLLPVYPVKRVRNLYKEYSLEYESFWPSWLEEPVWSGMINIDGQLYMRHFSRQNNWVILVTAPVDTSFLRSLSGFRLVEIALSNSEGTHTISTSDSKVRWWQNPILLPFSSRWDNGAFDWSSGLFRLYGSITFGIRLTTAGAILENTSLLHFFYSGQKLSAVKMFLAIILIVSLCVLIALVFGGYLVRYITRSLNLLASGHEQIARGQLSFRLPYLGKDQLGAMGTSFNDMIESIQNLMTEVTEKEKYHEELRIARDIQMSLLPNIEQLEWVTNIAATCVPAHDVGGDYYEILCTETGEIGIFIADVSGKGTSAAFYMAELKGVLLALRHLWSKPHQLMVTLNEIMSTTLSTNVFVSAAYLLLDASRREGHLARAGHCPAFHVRADGKLQMLSPPGMAIGIATKTLFGKVLEILSFPMEDQDKIILYTDGLDEMTKGHELYGLERLKQVLLKNAPLGTDELKQAILKDVLDFLATDVQNDDLTLVVAGLPTNCLHSISEEARVPG